MVLYYFLSRSPPEASPKRRLSRRTTTEWVRPLNLRGASWFFQWCRFFLQIIRLPRDFDNVPSTWVRQYGSFRKTPRRATFSFGQTGKALSRLREALDPNILECAPTRVHGQIFFLLFFSLATRWNLPTNLEQVEGYRWLQRCARFLDVSYVGNSVLPPPAGGRKIPPLTEKRSSMSLDPE